MTDRSTDGSPELEAIIRGRIREMDGISFREFMELCLYHPEHGYYMISRERIGRGGDFFTSTSVHALFGRLIARQLFQMWELLGGGDFTVAEQGAGEGHLALDILDAAAAESPEFYRNLRYSLVEISPENRRRQEHLLDRHRDRVAWSSLEEFRNVKGCILSNELVDAFPVHIVERREGKLLEVFVVEKGEALGEELRPLSTPRLEEYFDLVGAELVEGNRAEVNLEALRWIGEVGKALAEGFVLTIDYGYPASDLFAPFRREGTLMCYHRHTAGEDPYVRVGAQDITAHIDFTALERGGAAQGLQTLWFGPQYRFLMGLGFVEALMELQSRETDEKRARELRLTLKNLILPEGGMGETFKVLVQGKNVGQPSLLCARRIGDTFRPGTGF